MASPRPSLLVAAASLLIACAPLAVACSADSDSDDQAESTTTVSVSTSDETSTTPTSPTSLPGEDTTSSTTAASSPSISVAVYWTRPFGQARPIDIPGYRDDPNGPFPFVLYGSAMNTGASAIEQPQVDVTWSTGGEMVHTAVAAARGPEGATLTELAPGESADLIVVVDDEDVANRLTDAVPSFEVHS